MATNISETYTPAQDNDVNSATMAETNASCIEAMQSGEVQPEIALTVDPALDKLLSKIKNEAMFELRRLKHQQRPVSEFCNKQQLVDFFSKRIPPPKLDVTSADQASASNKGNFVSDRAQQLSSLTTNAQDFMPEGVRLEVRGLFEQHKVTETLQGPLPQELNQVLQENIEHSQTRQQGRRTRSGHTHHHHQESNSASDLIATIRNRHRHRPRPARRQRRHVRFVPPENGQYPMPRRNQSQIVESLMQSPALNSLDVEAREEIVSEVRSLVQQQLVTSALSGEFRGVLELNIQQRVNRSEQGVSGDNLIQSLRQRRSSQRVEQYATDHRPTGDYSDDLRRDMREMKSQLEDLKQLMRVSFNLQLDIQRSIRQEVAAALSAFLAPQQPVEGGLQPPQACPIPTLNAQGGIVQTTSPTVHVPIVECGQCTICSDGVIDSVIYRCGHMCTCVSCGLELKSKGLKCPICRAPITDVIRAYSSMM